MTQGQVKVLAVGTRHAVSATPHDIILCLGGHGMPCPYGYPHCDVGWGEADGDVKTESGKLKTENSSFTFHRSIFYRPLRPSGQCPRVALESAPLTWTQKRIYRFLFGPVCP